jgi:hypothetical protein
MKGKRVLSHRSRRSRRSRRKKILLNGTFPSLRLCACNSTGISFGANPIDLITFKVGIFNARSAGETSAELRFSFSELSEIKLLEI